MDGWSIVTSGLPPRIVHSLKRTRIGTIGNLRELPDEARRKIRGLGAGSLSAIDSFFGTCSRIEAGALQFPTVRELLLFLLTPVQYEILNMRYSLTRDMQSSGATLQAIGARRGVTRERTRQLEMDAMRILRTDLARACLKGLEDVFDDFIRENHGVVLPEDLARLDSESLLAGFKAQGVFVLLSDCGSALSAGHGFFANLPPAEMEALTDAILKLLATDTEPQSFPRILDRLAARRSRASGETSQRLVRSLLDHSPSVSATEDDRYFLFKQGAAHLVRRILARQGRPVHFRGITRELNTILRPGHRKGTGHVLDILHHSPLFLRTTSGYYQLRESSPRRRATET